MRKVSPWEFFAIAVLLLASFRMANYWFGFRLAWVPLPFLAILLPLALVLARKEKSGLQTELEKTKLDTRLEVAAALRKTIFPPTIVDLGRYRITSFHRPAGNYGGDWWGYIAGKNSVALFIGDVTGHGFDSTLLAATTQGFLSMLQDQVNESKGDILFSPSQAMTKLNHLVYKTARSELQMTALCLIIDFETGQFRFTNAAHQPVYRMKFSDEKLKMIQKPGLRLGEAPEFETPLKEIEGIFNFSQERILLHTDGIQDLGASENQLGRVGFKRFLQANLKCSGEQLVEKIENTLMPLNQGAALSDDVTIVVLELKS